MSGQSDDRLDKSVYCVGALVKESEHELVKCGDTIMNSI